MPSADQALEEEVEFHLVMRQITQAMTLVMMNKTNLKWKALIDLVKYM